MKKNLKNEKIKHLSNQEVEKLMDKYYQGERVNDLIQEYKLDVMPSSLYKLFPPIVIDNKICQYCNLNLVKDRPSKTNVKYNNSIEYCISCGHQDKQYCRCKHCQEQSRVKKQNKELEATKKYTEKMALIQEVYDVNKYTKIPINDLNFKDKVYIGALLRLALSEDMKTIKSLSACSRKLAPTPDYIKELLCELLDKRILLINPESNLNAFIESDEEGEFPYRFYISRVEYLLNIEFNTSYEQGISKLLNPDILEEFDKDEALQIWKGIALQEVLEYLMHQMKSVKFDFNIGEKTQIVFQDLLESFSVAQNYSIIYRSVANATKYYQESNITKRQAANSVISRCQTYGEKAVIEKWDIAKYNRLSDLPQSVLSEFFFNKVVMIGDLGFNMPPVNL